MGEIAIDVKSDPTIATQQEPTSMLHADFNLPKIEVRFQDLSIEARDQSGQKVPPTLLNFTLNAVEDFFRIIGLSGSKEKPFKILDMLDGIIRPSRMTLILGPPGCGKSTLLQALAGKLDSALKVRGRVSYNGSELDHFIPRLMCSYVSQHDLHHPEMTVRETLEFAEQMLRNVDTFEAMEEKAKDFGSRQQTCKVTSRNVEGKQKPSLTEYVIHKLRLQECADVIIGDEMRRGISGGEKKRVTIGEMLVGLSRCFFMDDISTGLDSSTAFEILEFLRDITHSLDLTMAISLLQPPQEMYDLFDDIMILCDGKIIFQGPREDVLRFFDYMGFKCPERKNAADFLQEVMSRMDQRQYWKHDQHLYSYIPPEKFRETFKCHGPLHFRKKEYSGSTCFKDESCTAILSKESYQMSKIRIFKACFSRESLLVKRNMVVHIFKNIQIALLAFVIMTVFFRKNMKHLTISDGNNFMGAIFAGIIIVKFNGMTELAMTRKRLQIFYKQRDSLFLPSWAFLSSIVLLSLPMSILETGLWTSLTYYTIGFAPSLIRFLQQFLAFFCIHQMSMGVFRFIAAVGRTEVLTNALGIITLLAIFIFGGIAVSKDNIPPWLVWGYWASPLTYGQNAVAVNEFSNKRWNMPIQYGNMTYTVGKAILKSRGIFTEESWFWVCLGALLGFSILFNIFSLIALAHLNYPHKKQANRFSLTEHQLHSKVTEKIAEAKNHRKTILPFHPMTLAFQHINYYVDTPTEMRKRGYPERKLQLLQDVTGAFRPGILTALMGVTGAGKTTLLDVLSGRKTGGYIEGSISVSGYPKKQETFSRISGYCEQNDMHSPFITILESLQYSARLRLSSNLGNNTLNEIIDEVMDLVELKPIKKAMVGVPGLHGLSAEQRKRLTIAVELVSSPSILFMDEPTTGLDARAAAIVMRAVKKTVKTGRTVVCTIHQPSIEIFEAFDELLLMKTGGKLIYGGPLGPLSKNIVQYFQAIPGVPNIREMQNPAVWMLDTTSTAMELKLGINYADVYKRSPLFKKNNELVDELSKSGPGSRDLHFQTRYEQNFASQFIACLWKQNVSYWKNPEQNVIRFVATLATSFLFGAVFWRTGSTISTEQDVFNVLGVMYGVALFLGFTTCNLVLPVMGMEKAAFYRERSAGMYSSMPYAMAQVAVEIPYIMIQVIMFSVIVYPTIGFQLVETKFLWFMILVLLSIIYFTLFGMMAAALTPNQEIAALFSFFLFVLWNMFSGFFIPRKMIPVWWRWFYWADPAAWTVYGLMASQLGDNTQMIKLPGAPDQTIKEFLNDYLDIQENHFLLALVVQILFAVFFLFIFFIGIKHINFQKR